MVFSFKSQQVLEVLTLNNIKCKFTLYNGLHLEIHDDWPLQTKNIQHFSQKYPLFITLNKKMYSIHFTRFFYKSANVEIFYWKSHWSIYLTISSSIAVKSLQVNHQDWRQSPYDSPCTASSFTITITAPIIIRGFLLRGFFQHFFQVNSFIGRIAAFEGQGKTLEILEWKLLLLAS